MGRPNMKRVLFVVLAFFALYVIAGFFLIPPLLKSIAVQKLTESLHRKTAIREVKVNPFSLSITVSGFSLAERQAPGTFASFEELFVSFSPSSITRRAPVVRELRIAKPSVHITRHSDGSYNFSDLLSASAEESKSAPVKFSLNNVQILEGNIVFVDGPSGKTHTVRNMTITVPFISDLPSDIDIFVKPSFSATVNGAAVSFAGETKPFSDSLETTLNVRFEKANIPFYLAYAPFKMNYQVASGSVSFNGRISYVQPKRKEPSLTASGAVEISDLVVNESSGKPMVSIPEARADITEVEILSKQVHLASVEVSKPSLVVARDEGGSINIESLRPAPRGAEVKDVDTRGAPVTLRADEVYVTDGRIEFFDLFQGKPFRTVLEPLDISVTDFATTEGSETSYRLSFATEAGENFSIDGTFSLMPLHTAGNIAAEGVKLPKYGPYYPGRFLVEWKEGVVTASADFEYSRADGQENAVISGLQGVVSSVRLRRRGEGKDLLRLADLSVKDVSMDLEKRLMIIPEIQSRGGEVALTRFKDGSLSTEVLEKIPTVQKIAEKVPEWVIRVEKATFDGYGVDAKDLVPEQPFAERMSDMRLEVSHFSTEPGSSSTFSGSCRIDKKGLLSASGSFAAYPLGMDFNVTLKDVDITPFQPYVDERLNIFLASGTASGSGTVKAGKDPHGDFSASFAGEAKLADVSVLEMPDIEDLLKWQTLTLDGISLSFNPTRVDIRGVAATDFYSRVILESEGVLNLTQLRKGPTALSPGTPKDAGTKATQATTESPEASLPIDIQTVTMQGGHLNFTDRSIKPNYNARITELSGRVSGLSSDPKSLADVDLFGKVNEFAPVEITGKINPLRDELYVDLKADFRNVDLSPVSPYSGKYIGYTISKGKLNADVEYTIKGRSLDSKNNFILDQLTLGNQVESTQATKLPVKLAIALLKNRNGEIRLDMPISGSLDDPEFSVGKVIVKIIVNLLVKAATAPFALLGAIFGGGAELSHIEFDPGVETLSKVNTEKLDTLAKALYERPGLKLEIEGHVDPRRDSDALREIYFMRRLKAQKLLDIAKKGGEVIPLDDVDIKPEEYERYLTMAYKDEKFPKPKNVLGMDKSLPVVEMEKLMRANIKITDEDLRELAAERAIAAERYLIKTGKVGPERVFLLEPKATAPEQKKEVKDSRVDFTLT